eukprot:SAG11_NODE_24956_length_365_cov_1.357143_2_plen_29_part_01
MCGLRDPSTREVVQRGITGRFRDGGLKLI